MFDIVASPLGYSSLMGKLNEAWPHIWNARNVLIIFIYNCKCCRINEVIKLIILRVKGQGIRVRALGK